MRPVLVVLIVGSVLLGDVITAHSPASPAIAPQRVDVTPPTADAQVGQTLTFSAIGIDPSGKPMDGKPTAWFAAPFDSAAADLQGNVTFFAPGQIRVGAIVSGKSGFAIVTVRPQAPAIIQIDTPASPVIVGGGINLHATALTASGNPLADVELTWRSESTGIAAVDAAGLVTALAPGVATIRATTGA